MADLIKVIVKEPGKIAETRMIENTLETYQALVGGCIETIPFEKETVLICNDEGKIKGLPISVLSKRDFIFGTAVIVNTNATGDDFDSLTGSQLDALCRFFGILENKIT